MNAFNSSSVVSYSSLAINWNSGNGANLLNQTFITVEPGMGLAQVTYGANKFVQTWTKISVDQGATMSIETAGFIYANARSELSNKTIVVTMADGTKNDIAYGANPIDQVWTPHVELVVAPAPVVPVHTGPSFDTGTVVTSAMIMEAYGSGTNDFAYTAQSVYAHSSYGLSISQLAAAPGQTGGEVAVRAWVDGLIRQAFTEESFVPNAQALRGMNAVIDRLVDIDGGRLSLAQAEALNNGGSVEIFEGSADYSVAVTEASLTSLLNGLGYSDKLVLSKALAPINSNMSFTALSTAPGFTEALAVAQVMDYLALDIANGGNTSAIANVFADSGIDTIQTLDAQEITLIGLNEVVYDLQMIG